MDDALRARQKAAIIESLLDGATIMSACESAGIGRRTHYDWMERDAQYNSDVRAALAERVETVSDSLYVQAVNGNITAAIFYLCNRAPEQWKHVQHIKHDGEIKQNITNDMDAREEQLRKVLAENPWLLEAANDNGDPDGNG